MIWNKNILIKIDKKQEKKKKIVVLVFLFRELGSYQRNFT